jgi:hypothetical protein
VCEGPCADAVSTAIWCTAAEAPPPPTCVDNVAPVRQWFRRCEDAVEYCNYEGIANACCATCAPLTPWCADNGIEEAEWSLRAGLKQRFLGLLGTSCEQVVAAGQCDQTVQQLIDATPGVGGSDIAIHRQASANGATPVANYSCPESCHLCPRGDDVHRPPRAPRLLGEDWTCEADAPTPGPAESGGATHSFHFTCPQTDPSIGGASENAAAWSHDVFAARQYAWLEHELSTSNADWKVVVGHYPVWSVAEHGPIPQMVNELKPLMEKYGVSMYFNGHDHNAQHINDGSDVEYFVVGAGSPVNPSQGHMDDVPASALKFFWARSDEQRQACQDDPTSGPECMFDSSIKDGSFAHVKFVDARTAEVELITHHGEVLYSLTKPNPATQTDTATGSTLPYRALDRTEEGAEQKYYVPYHTSAGRPTATPAIGGDGGSGNDGASGVLIAVGLLTVVVGAAVAAKLCVGKKAVGKPGESMYAGENSSTDL